MNDCCGFAQHESRLFSVVAKAATLRPIFDANGAYHFTQRDAVCYVCVIRASRQMTMVPEKREGMESPVNGQL
jgi:hypothetical protein